MTLLNKSNSASGFMPIGITVKLWNRERLYTPIKKQNIQLIILPILDIGAIIELIRTIINISITIVTEFIWKNRSMLSQWSS